MNENVIPTYLYKVTSPELWQQSKNKEHLLVTEHDHDFIHLAREDQLERIIEKGAGIDKHLFFTSFFPQNQCFEQFSR